MNQTSKVYKFAFVVYFLFWAIPSGAATPEMKAHFIDVGQGACALLEFPCGAVMIDTGAQDQEHVEHLVTYLTDVLDARPDLHKTLLTVFITHPHIDHAMGLKRIMDVCTVTNYVDDGITSGSGGSQVRWIRDKVNSGELKTHIREVKDDEITALPNKTGLTDDIIDPLKCDKCDPSIVVLSGGMPTNPGWSAKDYKNLNNQSLVIRVDFGPTSFLFTGDLQAPAIQTLVAYYRNTDRLDVNVWHVGHHGSYNATTEALLEAMTPEYAFIGVGHWNFGENSSSKFTTYAYGHPRKNVIDLLDEFIPDNRSKPIETKVFEASQSPVDCKITKNIYATGWDGDIILTADQKGNIKVDTKSTDQIFNKTDSAKNRKKSLPINKLTIKDLQEDSSPAYDSAEE